MQTNNQKIWQADKDHFIHPWTEFESFKKEGSIIIKEAKGSFVFDSDGKKYLDGIGGLWCINIGYGRKELGEVAAKQMDKMAYFSTFGAHTTEPAAFLAAKLAELAPQNLNRVFYSLSGSGANDTAVRTIHHYFHLKKQPQKKHIIAREGAYHGSTYLAMSLTGLNYDHIDFTVEKEWIHHISSPNLYRKPSSLSDNDFCDQLMQELEAKILSIGADKVAAFIAEPIMGAGGVLMAPKGYHKRALEICKKHDCFYISDEVVTAFGRLGHFFSSEKMFDIQPDIITCAKGLTSGYIPLGATLISDEIFDTISQPRGGKEFAHGFTYSGHPVSCAVGLKNIEILENEDFCGHVQKVGGYFEKKLGELDDLEIVGDVRGSHFMMCVEFVKDKSSKTSFDANLKVGERVSKYAQNAGLIIRPIGDKNVMSPPLCLSKEEADFLIATLRDSIVKVQDDLKTENQL